MKTRIELTDFAVGLLCLITALSVGCVSAGAQEAPTAAQPEQAALGRILLVLTNHGELGDTGKRTGAFLSEVAQPWAVFVEAGYDVTLASPIGGEAPLDPKSLRKVDADSQAFLDRFASDGVVNDTTSLSDVDPAHYDAIFFAGGHGGMWDFPTSESVRSVAQAICDQGGVLAAICHGPAALVQLKNAEGRPLVAGRKVTAFTDAEEESGRVADVMPFLLEKRLREQGADFDAAKNFKANVVVDGLLVTGQNPNSALGAAREVVNVLASKRGKSEGTPPK